jgi:hypothetical protein
LSFSFSFAWIGTAHGTPASPRLLRINGAAICEPQCDDFVVNERRLVSGHPITLLTTLFISFG